MNIAAMILTSSSLFVACNAPSNQRRSPASPVAPQAPWSENHAEPLVDLAPASDPSPHALPSTRCGLGPEDSETACVGVKMVAYEELTDNAITLSHEQASANISFTNQIWNPCGIQFQLEIYQPTSPGESQLNLNPADTGELPLIREQFEDSERFLVVVTGSWNRKGSLGNTGANAWASMPGNLPYGVIIEAPVASEGNIVAHELGHYLGLGHSDDAQNLMSPLIYENSVNLTQSDCTLAHSTLRIHWQSMLRKP